MIKKLVTKISGLFQFIYESLADNGDFNKAYYLFKFKHFVKYIKNKISKKTIPNSFWTDQSSVSTKENINKYKKFNEKEKIIDQCSTNTDEIIKNKKVYLMFNRYQHTGKGVGGDIARTYINTSKQVGINLKHFYIDNFQFESESSTVKSELRVFKPDYLLVLINFYLSPDKTDREKKLSFLRHMKDELGFKLIIYIGDPHSYGLEKEVRRFVNIADKILSTSSWTPLFSFEEFKSKLSPMQLFTDDNLFFPELKKIDMSFSGVIQPERAEIITFASFVASKLKLKTQFDLRRSRRNWTVTTRKIIDDETYIDILRKSKTIINISQKSTKEKGKPIHVINGRVTEAIACGAALIQYKPKDDTTLNLNDYYTPWKEYLPFSSRKELKEILYLLKYEPDTISEIGHNGRQRYLECYNAAKSWEKMLKIPC